MREFVDPDYDKLAGVIFSIILPFGPLVFNKIFKVEIPFRFQITYFLFLFAALFLGIDLDFYRNVPFYDKIVHLVSGALSVIVAWYTLLLFGAENTKPVFRVVFIICFCMAVAVLWEFFEFACDKLLGQSMQQLIQHGVDDTMYDMLAATIGAIVGVFALHLNSKKIQK